MKQIRWMSVLAAVVALSCGSAAAQDPVKVSPEIYKVRLDNDKVRVLEIHIKPGDKTAMHSHPAHVVIARSACKVKFTLPDGKTNVVDMKAGDIAYSDPVTHRADNVGTSECDVLNVELKEAATGMK